MSVVTLSIAAIVVVSIAIVIHAATNGEASTAHIDPANFEHPKAEAALEINASEDPLHWWMLTMWRKLVYP